MRTLRRLALSSLVGAVALSTLAPAAHPAAPARRSALDEWADGRAGRLLYSLDRAGVPDAVAERLQDLRPLSNRFVINLPWGDMTGDRRSDVLALEFEDGPGGLGAGGSNTHLEALSGRNGRTLWRRTFKDDIAIPIEIGIGKKGRAGVLMVSFDYRERGMTFVGVDSRGREAYRHTFTTTNSTDAGLVTGREEVVSFDLFDALPGKATELLIAIGDVRQLPQAHEDLPALIARTRTVLVDGRNGRLTAHPETEVGVGRVPIPLAGPDFDGDGLEDQVVTYAAPDVAYDEETGLPLVPDATAEHVRARRGSDGEKLWTSGPLDIAPGWESPNLVVTRLGDYKRDGSDEILLSLDPYGYGLSGMRWTPPPSDPQRIWSLSGKDGALLWRARAHSPTVVGDLDSDRRADVVTAVDISGKRKSGTRLVARSGLDGAPLYERFVPLKRRDDQEVESFVGTAGDLHPDGAQDVFLLQALRRDFDNGTEWRFLHPHLISGRTGRELRPSRHVSPLYASLDGHGDDLEQWTPGTEPGEARFVDGATRRLRLAVAFDIPLTLPADDDYLLALAARLDGDRCADFVGTLANDTTTFAVAIDGGSGKVMWSRRQLGLEVGGPVVQTRRIDHNRAC